MSVPPERNDGLGRARPDSRPDSRPFDHARGQRRPPWLAVWFLDRLLPEDARSDVVGDLVELYESADGAAGTSSRRGRLWFWGQGIRIAFAHRIDGGRRRPLLPRRSIARGGLPVRPDSPLQDHSSMIGTLMQDLRDAVRSLVRTPGYALACAGILALGLGAVATIYAVADAVLLRPLAFPEPHELVAIWGRYDADEMDRLPLTSWDVAHLRENADTLEDVGGFFQGSVTITGDGGDAEEVGFGWFTPNTIRVLGVEPILGRGLTNEDAGQLVVLLEYDLWQRRFGGDPEIIGRIITLAQQSWEVIGILPERPRLLLPSRARLPGRTEIWSMVNIPDNPDKTGAWMRLVGRLAPGATVQQAAGELRALAAREREAEPSRAEVGFGYDVSLLLEDFNADVAPVLTMVLGAGLVLLCVTAANLGGLMLLWGERRRREIAIRAALGSGRGRLVRHVLIGGLLIGMLGFLGAMALAGTWVSVLPSLTLPELPRFESVAIDRRVVLAALLAALACGAMFSLPTALRCARPDVETALRGNSAATTRRLGGAALLVGGEIAMAVVLLVGATLLVRTMAHLTRVDPGFESRDALTFRTAMPFADLFEEVEAYVALQERLDTALAEIPGVTAAGAAQMLPLAGGLSTGPYSPELATGLNDTAAPQADYRFASPGFLPAIGARLIEGRFYEWDDPPDAVVVDSLMAATLWPNQSAIGKQLGLAPFGGTEGWHRVVGVVQHLRHESLVGDGRPTVFFSLAHVPRAYLTMVVRTEGDPTAVVPAVRRTVKEVHADLPISRLRLMDEWVASASAEQRAAAWLLAGFSAMAILLVAVGLYSLLGFEVRLQSREVGLRLALGAEPARVVRGVIARSLRVAAAGLLFGVALALPATAAVSGLLFGVERLDPTSWLVVLLGIGVLAAVASALPARSAASVDPVEVLRAD